MKQILFYFVFILHTFVFLTHKKPQALSLLGACSLEAAKRAPKGLPKYFLTLKTAPTKQGSWALVGLSCASLRYLWGHLGPSWPRLGHVFFNLGLLEPSGLR